MLTGLLITATLIMMLFPETPLARSLHRHLVEWPLARLAAMDRRHAIFALILIGLALFGSELLVMLGSADLVVGLAWDVSIYADTLLAAAALAAVARSRLAWRALLVRPSRPRRPRARSRRALRAKPSARADDEEGPAWSLALAA
ncbi:MAG TPA: hypothetical protein VH331_08760 [Allosphingosinicella sp.]|jgi:hypothetical protein|nr:hypothetical protein [Allosphingosinicella sp.]